MNVDRFAAFLNRCAENISEEDRIPVALVLGALDDEEADEEDLAWAAARARELMRKYEPPPEDGDAHLVPGSD